MLKQTQLQLTNKEVELRAQYEKVIWFIFISNLKKKNKKKFIKESK